MAYFMASSLRPDFDQGSGAAEHTMKEDSKSFVHPGSATGNANGASMMGVRSDLNSVIIYMEDRVWFPSREDNPVSGHNLIIFS